jgi:hypothetical protein
MNERIKELADQVGLHDFVFEAMGIGEEFEQFAKLLVRECAMLVEGFILEQEVALDDYQEYEASAVLKEHFGVEE